MSSTRTVPIEDQPLTEASPAEMANAIRALAMDAVQKANSGHPGMPMGMADVATVLFTRFLKFDPSHPEWPDRDRFVLSAGHGSMLLYALLYLTGYPDMDIEQLKTFRQLGSQHRRATPNTATRPASRRRPGRSGRGSPTPSAWRSPSGCCNRRYGDELVDHFTYCIAGDGCLMEGISQEAISLAGHLKLGKPHRAVRRQPDLDRRPDRAFRLRRPARALQGVAAGIPPALTAMTVKRSRSPSRMRNPSPTGRRLIACRTIIGYGAPSKAGTASTHGAPLGADEVKGARERLNWHYPPFEVPEHILSSWREAGSRHRAAYEEWSKAASRLDASARAGLTDPIDAGVESKIEAAIAASKSAFAQEGAKLATRQSSQKVLEKLVPVIPGLVGGSADLTGSNGTLTKLHSLVKPGDFGGNYIHYGVREHGMAAAMNGMALHGGIVPYGGTFLVFSDYCRPAIRLAAMMGQRVIYVMTHDSIGLGEDGPTHQPVEQLAALRAMPNLNVFRPADSVECAECWEIALLAKSTPSILALTRQGVPILRHGDTKENLSAKGAYVLIEAAGERDVTLIGTGSELVLAVEAAGKLAEQGIKAAVVSMPCWELFDAQPEAYRNEVLGTGPARRRRGGFRVRLGEMDRTEWRLYRHAWIRGFSSGARPI